MIIVLEVFGILAILGAFGFLVWFFGVMGPIRAKAKRESLVTKNHLDLYLLLNDLVTLDRRGYVSVFTDETQRDHAEALLAAYRKELTQ